MRRLLPLCLALVVVAGCGGKGKSETPLDKALGYLPTRAPLVIVVDSDLSDGQYRAVRQILGRFPAAGRLQGLLRQQIERNGVSFSRDIQPLLGNPVVIGAPDTRAVDQNRFVGSAVVKDGDKLESLVKRSGAHQVGKSSGAKLYATGGGSVLAVEGSSAVIADNRNDVERALKEHDDGGGYGKQELDRELSGLPSEALLKVGADIQAFLRGDPGTAQARRVKWVNSLRTLGLTVSAASDRATLDFHATTDFSGLSEQDLPLSGGDENAPVISRAGEVGLGLRDPAQVVEFAQAAARAADPVGFGTFDTAKQQIKAGTHVDLDRDLVGAFTGEAAVSLTPDGRFGVRAPLKDPNGFRRTLARLARVVPSFVRGAGGGAVAVARPHGRNGFYAVAPAHGRGVVYGVVGDTFVAASDPRRAGAMVAAKASDVPGAKGSVVLHADAERVARVLLRRLAIGPLETFIGLGPLGALNGWVKSGTDGLTGRITLGFD